MIYCSCLLIERIDSILLVRVRNNTLWYLPGGKIEEHESPSQALCRELFEELGIKVSTEDLVYVTTVIAPNHDWSDKVSLVCFTCFIRDSFQPSAEISEVKWIKKKDLYLMAPAVRILVEGRRKD